MKYFLKFETKKALNDKNATTVSNTSPAGLPFFLYSISNHNACMIYERTPKATQQFNDYSENAVSSSFSSPVPTFNKNKKKKEKNKTVSGMNSYKKLKRSNLCVK